MTEGPDVPTLIGVLTDTLASGFRSEAILEKLKAQEQEKMQIKEPLSRIIPEPKKSQSMLGLTEKIKAFMADFDRKFERASISERKHLLRVWVRDIVVDREAEVVLVNLWTVPQVEEIAEAGSGSNKKGTHDSCECPL